MNEYHDSIRRRVVEGSGGWWRAAGGEVRRILSQQAAYPRAAQLYMTSPRSALQRPTPRTDTVHSLPPIGPLSVCCVTPGSARDRRQPVGHDSGGMLREEAYREAIPLTRCSGSASYQDASCPNRAACIPSIALTGACRGSLHGSQDNDVVRQCEMRATRDRGGRHDGVASHRIAE